MMSSPLERLLRPASVAVVGASSDPTKRGHQAVRALRNSGYSGRILPVHPEGGELLGLPVFPSVSELPLVPDLVLIAVAAERVPSVIERCAQAGIGGAVVLAVGFRESGNRGAALEREVVGTARRTGMRVIGPNTSGILNPHIGLNLVGVDAVTPGGLAVLSQSGNIGLDLMTAMATSGVSLSLYVGVGNEGDVAFHEYLEYLELDPTTQGILVYSEGFQDPESFLRVVERVNRSKPVVVLKGGRSERGVEAALSHTGAIAGSYDVFKAVAAQRGVLVVDRSDEFLVVGKTLTFQVPIAPGKGVAIIADGGGHATLAVDLLAERDLPLARFSTGVRKRLGELLGSAAANGNPIDMAGAADRRLEVFAKVAEAVVAEDDVGGVLLTGLFGGYALRFDASLESGEARVAGRIAALCSRAGKPLIVHTVYAAGSNPALDALRSVGIPVVGSLDIATRCIDAAVERGKFLARTTPTPAVAAGIIPTVAEPRPVQAARKEGRRALTEWEARSLLEAHDIPVVPATLCRTVEEAAKAAARQSGPVVLKLLSGTIFHRTEAGGIELGLSGPDEAASAFERIRDAAARFAEVAGCAADFRGVLVSPMLERPTAELMVACRRDPQYGPILVLAAGGVMVEVSPDRVVRGLPLRDGDFGDMVGSLRIAPIFGGHRGAAGVDPGSVERLCQGLGRLLVAHPGLQEIELNPVFAYPSKALAVDALAVLADY
ncbi:MAG: acetate--CoA ligase family protein [Pirellulales bacterium]